MGKWWGRKPLVLVRATILGVLLPATNDPVRDREVFLKLMTKDEKGLSRRKDKKLNVAKIYAYATDLERKQFFRSGSATWRTDAQIVWSLLTVAERQTLFQAEPDKSNSGVIEGVRKKDMQEREKEIRRRCREAKESLESRNFHRLPYSEKLTYCQRPEQIEGPSKDAWDEINAHLGTGAQSLPELVEELGRRRFGHRPRVGDSFCGAGSVPFEAARIGCDAYGSDLSPVAVLLTWAARNLIGGGDDAARKVEQAHQEIFEAVNRQVTEWEIEHNDQGWQVDAYVYCLETTCPECKWSVPLAPMWVLGETSRAVAELVPDESAQRFEIQIHERVSAERMKRAMDSGTVRDSRLYCPRCGPDKSTEIDAIRRLGGGKDPKANYHESGLRLWEKGDLVPRSDDVFQERLYCIRWVETYRGTNAKGKEVQKTRRHYRGPTAKDLEREQKVLKLLRERFQDWQQNGYIPSRRIEPGAKTTDPIRTRGWTHWHHLFTPRQLLLHGLISSKIATLQNRLGAVAGLFALAKCCNFSAKLSQYRHQAGNEARTERVFYNQAFNVFYNHGCRPLIRLEDIFAEKFETMSLECEVDARPADGRNISEWADLWITDPPYADAIYYHELGEFFQRRAAC